MAVPFDAYGTLFDVYSVGLLAEQLFPQLPEEQMKAVRAGNAGRVFGQQALHRVLRAREQQLSLARIPRQLRGAPELRARLVVAAEFGEQVAAHAG